VEINVKVLYLDSFSIFILNLFKQQINISIKNGYSSNFTIC